MNTPQDATAEAIDHPLLARFAARLAALAPGEGLPQAEARELFDAFAKLAKRFARVARISDRYQGEIKRLVMELQQALANVKTLNGFIPICACCKKIRSDDGYWKQLEQYIAERSDALFSHGLCPECSSNYRSLALKHPPESQAPAHLPPTLEEADLDDPVIIKYLPILNNKHFARSPLYGDFSVLFQKYLRLSKRMKRIARISDSYQAQMKALEEAQRLDTPPTRSPLRQTPLMVIKPEGTIAYVSAPLTRLLGYTREEIPTLAAWWERTQLTSDRQREAAARWEAGLERARASGGELNLGDSLVLDKAGEGRLLEMAGVLVGEDVLLALTDVDEGLRPPAGDPPPDTQED